MNSLFREEVISMKKYPIYHEATEHNEEYWECPYCGIIFYDQAECWDCCKDENE